MFPQLHPLPIHSVRFSVLKGDEIRRHKVSPVLSGGPATQLRTGEGGGAVIHCKSRRVAFLMGLKYIAPGSML